MRTQNPSSYFILSSGLYPQDWGMAPGCLGVGAAVLHIHGPSVTKSVCPPPPSPSWVGYQKAGFRGHQYLLEEGEYADWSHWGGYDEALTSLRVIRTVSKGHWAIPLPVAPARRPLPQYNLFREELVPSFLVRRSTWKCSLRSSLLPSCCSFPGHTDRLTPKSPGGLYPRGLGTPRVSVGGQERPDYPWDPGLWGPGRGAV